MMRLYHFHIEVFLQQRGKHFQHLLQHGDAIREVGGIKYRAFLRGLLQQLLLRVIQPCGAADEHTVPRPDIRAYPFQIIRMGKIDDGVAVQRLHLILIGRIGHGDHLMAMCRGAFAEQCTHLSSSDDDHAHKP